MVNRFRWMRHDMHSIHLRDGAIELADRALKMTRDERIQEFKDLLNAVKINKKSSKNSMKSCFET